MTPLVAVRIGECLCSGAPHADGDFVSLAPVPDQRGGFRMKRHLIALNRAAFGEEAMDMGDLEANLAEAYLTEGIREWNLVDEEEVARPINADTLKAYLFNDYSRSSIPADIADDLYRPLVLDPLVQRALSSLPDTPTPTSTSPTNGLGSKRKQGSKRSSTSTSLMAGTETIT